MKPAVLLSNRRFFAFSALFMVMLLFPLEAQAQKEWTIMVYMAADNNLEPAAIDDINEMEMVGSTIYSNVVVQVDRTPNYDNSNGNWTTTRRYYITQDQEDAFQINSTLIADLGEKNMGDPQTLQDFISWAMVNYPAEKYCLILWDHGSGWREQLDSNNNLVLDKFPVGESNKLNEASEFLVNPNNKLDLLFPPNPLDYGGVKYMCNDETDGDELYNDEIQAALSSFPKLDILGFDACLMGMLEVAYEFKDQAYYMVASEETEPKDGWPYDLILFELYYSPAMSAAELCSTIVNCYAYQMQNQDGYRQTLSAIDLLQVNQVIIALDVFCNELVYNGIWSEMEAYFPSAEQFGDAGPHPPEPFYDLYNIADIAWLNLSGAGIINAADALKSAIDNAVISE
jgi:hypothetical protein